MYVYATNDTRRTISETYTSSCGTQSIRYSSNDIDIQVRKLIYITENCEIIQLLFPR